MIVRMVMIRRLRPFACSLSCATLVSLASLALASLALVSLAGCGSSDRIPPAPPAGRRFAPSTVGGQTEDWATARCNRAFQCGASPKKGATPDGCVTYILGSICQKFDCTEGAKDTPDQRNACVAALQVQSCDTIDSQNPCQ